MLQRFNASYIYVYIKSIPKSCKCNNNWINGSIVSWHSSAYCCKTCSNWSLYCNNCIYCYDSNNSEGNVRIETSKRSSTNIRSRWLSQIVPDRFDSIDSADRTPRKVGPDRLSPSRCICPFAGKAVCIPWEAS